MAHHPHIQQHLAERIGVAQSQQGPGCCYLNPDLFAQLALKSRPTIFAGAQLAAWEFPSSRQVFAGRSLRDQHPVGRVDHRAGDDMNSGTRVVEIQPLACCKVPWQCLYLRPDPQGQGSLRPTLGTARTNGVAAGAVARGSNSMILAELPVPGTCEPGP